MEHPAGFWAGFAGPFPTYDEAVSFVRSTGHRGRYEIEDVTETGQTIAVWSGEIE